MWQVPPGLCRLLCGLLFERIDASNGRIVVVSSEGHKMGLKTIQFDDMNWEHNYHPNKVYSHSKLAQMMFAYELQDRIEAADRQVNVFVCHPGASNTSLIRDNANLATRLSWAVMVKTGMAQRNHTLTAQMSTSAPSTLSTQFIHCDACISSW